MLKKIIAIFLSLTFVASAVVLHTVLITPDNSLAAALPIFRTLQSMGLPIAPDEYCKLSGDAAYLLLPYSFIGASRNSVADTPLTGGLYRISYNADLGFSQAQTGTEIVLNPINSPSSYKFLLSGRSTDNAYEFIHVYPTQYNSWISTYGFHTTSGTGSKSDPYVVYGL